MNVHPTGPRPLGRDLTEAYRRCRDISARHGRTYHLATRLLAGHQRPAVHALYAFARVVDDIVDVAGFPGIAVSSPGAVPVGATVAAGITYAGNRASTAPGPVELLDLIEDQLRAALALPSDGPRDEARHAGIARALPEVWPAVLAALTDTVRRFDIAPEHFTTFLASMRMDIAGTPLFRDRYATFAELREYMRGSAAAIGLQLVPVLGTVGARAPRPNPRRRRWARRSS